MPIPIQCTHCEAILKLKDEAEDTLGRKMRCPECGEPFVMKRYRPQKTARRRQEVEEPEADYDDYDDAPSSRRSKKRGAGKKRRPIPVAKIVIPLVIAAVVIGGGTLVWKVVVPMIAVAERPAAQEVGGNVAAQPQADAPPTEFHVPAEFASWKPFTIAPGVCEVHLPTVPNSKQLSRGVTVWSCSMRGFDVVIKHYDFKASGFKEADVIKEMEKLEKGVGLLSGGAFKFAGRFNGQMSECIAPAGIGSGQIKFIHRAIVVPGNGVLVSVDREPSEAYQQETEFLFGSLKLMGLHDPGLAARYSKPNTSLASSWPRFDVPDVTPSVSIQAPQGFNSPSKKMPKLLHWEFDSGDVSGFVAISDSDLSADDIETSFKAYPANARAIPDTAILSEKQIQIGNAVGVELRQRLGASSFGIQQIFKLPTRVLLVHLIGSNDPTVIAQQEAIMKTLTIDGQTAN